MKKTGIIILSIGLLFTLITTFGILVKERVTDPKKVEMAQIKIDHLVWEPMLGAILIMIGVGLYKMGKKGEVKMVT
ncbi:MAG TPA: hypothetical protein VGQ59_18680 [Cyclobacteriaceae bacterium]|jgi:multisubunit Na+/H+ antiporter MnhG subunit|nr:hypothetical protein [Cyclobacteriaceae bacterium]